MFLCKSMLRVQRLGNLELRGTMQCKDGGGVRRWLVLVGGDWLRLLGDGFVRRERVKL